MKGDGSRALFENESGGHRWQRIPPTERKGRIHTSTVTVAVLDLETRDASFDVTDVEITTTRGSGPGGQNRNRVETCVVATHRPTGISVRIDGRSQYQNKQLALKVLASRLSSASQEKAESEQNNTRKSQVGTGMRGDKIRTYRVQDDRITDHRTNQKLNLASWMRGEW